MTDPYQILGVYQNATEGQIKKRYLELAKKLHPDRENGDETSFKILAEAYGILMDPVKRQEYDLKMYSENVENARHGISSSNISHTLLVSFDQLFSGTRRQIRVHRHVNGRTIEKVLTVHIQPGTPSGHQIILKGLGNNNGDLILTVKGQLQDGYWYRGDELMLDLRVTLKESLIGFKKEIRCLDGSTVILDRVGITEHGFEHRIKGKGIRGKDLVVKVLVNYPERLPEEVTQFLDEHLRF